MLIPAFSSGAVEKLRGPGGLGELLRHDILLRAVHRVVSLIRNVRAVRLGSPEELKVGFSI